MRSVSVRAREHRYEVLIAANLLEKAGELARGLVRGPRCAVVSDTNVASLFGDRVLNSLQRAGFAPELISIAPGEDAKSMSEAAALCERLGAAGLDRSSFLVSLGGGVVGDLAGFVGAIYLRGIPYVSVPTTLLAQVDSAIGGKTGVNSGAGKNLIGSLHHPALVIADTETLRHLPDRIWNEGFAEIIKHGIIRDAELFEKLGARSSRRPNDDATWQLGLADLQSLIARNVEIKAEIVAADEREQTGERSLLNFGHTIGHAVEHAAGGSLLHGEALSLGMVVAARLSVRRAGLSLGEAEKIIARLKAFHLPTKLPPDFPREKIFAALPRDKKFEQGRIRFVVVSAIGHGSVSENVTMNDLREAVAEL